MKSAVIVLTWNSGRTAMACLRSLQALAPAPSSVLVVDNASQDGTAEAVAAHFPGFNCIRNERNLGFAGGMNRGIRALLAQPDPPALIVLLNQDTQVDPGWLEALEAPFADEEVGAVGCKIRYPDGTLQHAGVSLAWPRAVAHHVGWHEADEGQHNTPRELEQLSFAAVALRSTALQRVGLLDEGYGPAYYEDMDLCLRLRRTGYKLVYAPAASLVHQESQSVSDELVRSAYYNYGRMRYVLKHYSLADLTGPFAAAERAFAHVHARYAEGRALRFAYHENLAGLTSLLNARRELEPDLPVEAGELLAGLLSELRHELAASLYQQAQTCADGLQAL